MEIVAIMLAKGDQIRLQLFIFLFARRLARRLPGRWRNSVVIFQLMKNSRLPKVAYSTLCLLHGASFFFFFKVGANKENAIRSITLGERVCLLVAGLEKQADVRLA